MKAIRWLGPEACPEAYAKPETFASRVPTTRFGRRPDRTCVRLFEDPDPTLPDLLEGLEPGVQPELDAEPQPGTERYQVQRLLGQGSFGRVFLAFDTKLGRSVALKVLNHQHAADPEIRERFVQEAHAAASIAHPGVVTIFDAGVQETTNTAYIVMELLDGESLLAHLARSGRMASARVREIGRQVADALETAHQSGVIHRDLKSENIFLVRDPAMPGGERVKVIDFGLARPTRATVVTQASMVFGTPMYMSPEQIESTNVDHRSDIYALGCTLFELVTGRPPFEGSIREVTSQHRSARPPSLRALVPDACPELDALIQNMLAKDPAARPPTMQAVAQALVGPPAGDETVQETRGSTPGHRFDPLRTLANYVVSRLRPLGFIAAVICAALCLTTTRR